ncbi:MAG: CDP-alcohol phosphatidyltransferase family protein [Deltaproteobacteria bacterium]|nr:CDP-alcohol phosphatidyltransferase family protein [Deltaproteobacteria bacterium]
MPKNYSSNQSATLNIENINYNPAIKVAGLTVPERLIRQLIRTGYKNIYLTKTNLGYWQKLKKKYVDVVDFSDIIIGDLYEINTFYDGNKLGEVFLGETKPDKISIMDISSERDLVAIKKHLWSSLRKPIENDGIIAYFLGRPVSRIFSAVLINFPVSPNHATILSAVFALTGSFVLGYFNMLFFGALLYWFSFVFDCIDGEIARLKVQGSTFGQWLDTVVDDIATVAFSLGLGFYIYKSHPTVAIVIWSSAGLYSLSSILVYKVLKKIGVIDTAQYPYFFLGDKGSASQEKGFFTYLAYLFRRDVILFAHLLLSIGSFYWGMYIVQITINAGMVAITFLDQLVKLITRKESV